MANGTDELTQDATDFLGRKVPVAFKNQPALPAVGPPAGASAGPVTPGVQGATQAASGAAAAGAEGGSAALAQALKALNLTGRFGEIAKKLYPSKEGVTAPPGAMAGAGAVASAAAGGGVGTGSSDLTLSTAERLTGPGVNEQVSILKELAAKGFISQEELATQLQGLGAVGGGAPGGLTAADINLATTAEQGVTGAADYTAAASGLTGLLTGYFSKQGMPPPSTEEEAYLRMALDLVGALSGPVTLGFGSGITSAIEFGLSDLFRPHIPHAVREAREVSGLYENTRELMSVISRARTPEELADAFGYVNQRRTTGEGQYPLAAGFDLQDRAAAIKAFQGDEPVSFGWQAGVPVERLTTANDALNQSVQMQIALMRAAEAGDPSARQILDAMRRESLHTGFAISAAEDEQRRQMFPDLYAPQPQDTSWPPAL